MYLNTSWFQLIQPISWISCGLVGWISWCITSAGVAAIHTDPPVGRPRPSTRPCWDSAPSRCGSRVGWRGWGVGPGWQGTVPAPCPMGQEDHCVVVVVVVMVHTIAIHSHHSHPYRTQETDHFVMLFVLPPMHIHLLPVYVKSRPLSEWVVDKKLAMKP